MNLDVFLSKKCSTDELDAYWAQQLESFVQFWNTFKRKKRIEWNDFEGFYRHWSSLEQVQRLVFALRFKDPKWKESAERIEKKYQDLVHKIFEGRLMYRQMSQLNKKKLLTWQRQVLNSSGVLQTIGWSPLKVRQKQHLIQGKITKLERKVNANVVESQKQAQLWVDKKHEKDLIWLPEALIKKAKERAESEQRKGLIFKPYSDEYDTFMMYCQNRTLRHQMYRIKNGLATEFKAAGQYDNSAVVQTLLKERKKEANFYGFETYAHMVLSNSILKTQQKVVDFLEDLVLAVYPNCAIHYDEIVRFAKQAYQWKSVQPWDYRFLQHQYNVHKHSLEQKQLIVANMQTVQIKRSCGLVLKKTLQVLSGLLGFSVHMENQKRTNGFWKCTLSDAQNVCLGHIVIFEEKSAVLDMDELPFNVDVVMGQKGKEALSVIFLQRKESQLWEHWQFVHLLHELGHAIQNMLTKPEHEQLGVMQLPVDAGEVFSQLFEYLAFEDQVVGYVFGKNNTMLWKSQRLNRLHKDALIMNQIVDALADIKLHSVYNPNGRKKPWVVLGEVRKSVYMNDIKAYNRRGNQLRTLSGTYPCSEYQYLLGEVFAGLIWEKMGQIAQKQSWEKAFELMRNCFFDAAVPKRFDWAIRQFCNQGFDIHALIRGRKKMDGWFNV